MRSTSYVTTVILLAIGIMSIGQGFAQSDSSSDVAENLCMGAICFGTLGIIVVAALIVFAILVIAILIYLLKKDRQ